MTKLLVTGAEGQLGRSLRRIFDNEPQLAVTYIDIDRLDLTDKSAVDTFFDNARYDIVINCAAYTAVDLAEKNEVACSHINTDAVTRDKIDTIVFHNFFLMLSVFYC